MLATKANILLLAPLVHNYGLEGTSDVRTDTCNALSYMIAWPSGLRRWFKAPVSSEAWVRIPPLSLLFPAVSSNLPFFRASLNS